MTSLILFSSHYDSEPVGRAAGNSGQHPVSPAPSVAGSRERLDRPAAYPHVHSRTAMPWPFAEFYAAIRG